MNLDEDSVCPSLLSFCLVMDRNKSKIKKKWTQINKIFGGFDFFYILFVVFSMFDFRNFIALLRQEVEKNLEIFIEMWGFLNISCPCVFLYNYGLRIDLHGSLALAFSLLMVCSWFSFVIIKVLTPVLIWLLVIALTLRQTKAISTHPYDK